MYTGNRIAPVLSALVFVQTVVVMLTDFCFLFSTHSVDCTLLTTMYALLNVSL